MPGVPLARRTVLAVALVFAGNGIVVGAWAVRVAEIQRAHGLSEAGLGVALICVGAGALLAMPVTGALAIRFGSAACIRVLILILAAAVAIAAISSSVPLLLVGLALLGAANGGLDVSMSSQAVAVERVLRRPMMSTLHAVYSFGYLLSALVGGFLASAGVPVEAHLAAVGTVAAVSVLATSSWLILDRPDAESGVRLRSPSRQLLLFGAIAFCALLTEGSITDWCSVYVRQVLDAAPAVAGLALGAFGAGMALSRLTGDRIRARFGPTALVVTGATATASALGLALAIGQPGAMVPAWLVAGLGLGNCFPVALAAAGAVGGRTGVGPAVASVATVGYTGFLMGPAVIGLLTAVVSLGVALCTLVVAMILIVLLAPSVRAAAVPHSTGGRQG